MDRYGLRGFGPPQSKTIRRPNKAPHRRKPKGHSSQHVCSNRVWNPPAYVHRVAKLRNFTHQWADVQIAPNGRYALVAVDTYLQRVKLTREKLRVVKVNRRRPKSVATRKNKAFVPKDNAYDIAVSRNGRWLYVKVHRGIKVFALAQPRKPELVCKIKGPESRGELSMTRDGRRLISLSWTGRDRYTVYSLAEQARPRRLTTKRPRIGDVYTLATNRTGGRAYVVSAARRCHQHAEDETGRRHARRRLPACGGHIERRPEQGRAYVVARKNSSGNRVLVEIRRR